MVEYNPKIPIILDSIRLLYELPDCGTGGNCHIVTDDHKLTDNDL